MQEFTSTTELHGLSCSTHLVPPDEVNRIWDFVEPFLGMMTPYTEGELLPEDFYESLTNGGMQLWVAVTENEVVAAMVTQVIPYPRKNVLRIICIGGQHMDKWLRFFPRVEDFALYAGCSSMECWGRKGWLRILKDWGWKCSYHIITKDLKKTRMH